jgi:hypothetical protein
MSVPPENVIRATPPRSVWQRVRLGESKCVCDACWFAFLRGEPAREDAPTAARDALRAVDVLVGRLEQAEKERDEAELRADREQAAAMIAQSYRDEAKAALEQKDEALRRIASAGSVKTGTMSRPEHATSDPRLEALAEIAREALVSLPVREDAPQAEAGGGKSRRSGEGPH